MLRKFVFGVMIVSFCTVFGCKISGTVEKDGVGFKGITVNLNDNQKQTTTTDSNGNYEFGFVFPGLYRVTVENCDTIPEDKTVDKLKQPFETVADVDFSIPEKVWEGDYYPADHDGSLEDLTGYTSVTGFLYIAETDMTDLKGLECLETVGAEDSEGGVFIGINDSLASLDGLNNLKSVKFLFIQGCSTLTSVDALESLTNVSETMYIAETDLTTLEGLDNLTMVGGALFIVLNNSLTTVDGLENLSSIGSLGAGGGESQTDCLFLVGNPLLQNVNGLSSLESVENELNIVANGSLTDLNGLNNLTQVGSLGIGFDEGICGDDTCTSGPLDNPLLTSLSGLNNLETVENNLWINANSGLTDLGLTSLTTVGGDFSITDNVELCEDLATTLQAQATISGTTIISGNKTTCP